MYYNEITPPPMLADIVKTFWVLDTGLITSKDQSFRVFAREFAELHYLIEDRLTQNDSCRSTKISTLSIDGQSTEFRQNTSSGLRSLSIVGVCLYPHALNLLFDVDVSELTDQSLSIDLLHPPEGHELKQKLDNAQNSTERIQILSRFLILKKQQVGSRDLFIESCIRQIIDNEENVSLDQLMAQANISRRQFERRFLFSSGISPKTFMQINRFHKSLRLNEATTVHSLAELAQLCGYYDQSHFSREFKRFSGMTPGNYFSYNGDVADNFVQLD